MPMASQPKQRPQADGEAARGARPIIQRPAIGLVNVLVTTVSLQLLTDETGRRFVTTPSSHGWGKNKIFPKEDNAHPK